MTVNIDESPAKREMDGGRPYDEASAGGERKIHTVWPVRFRIFPPDTCTYDVAVGCNPEHRYYMIDLNTWIDYHW